MRHVDDKGLVDGLAAGEVGIEGAAHVFLGAQRALSSPLSIARHDAQRHVGRVEAPAERVGVLFENHVADIVNQVVFANLHQRGRGTGPFDPDLAVQHACAEVGGCSAKIIGDGGRPGSYGSLGDVGDEQLLDYLRIGLVDDRLAADEGGRWRMGRVVAAGGGEKVAVVARCGRKR